MIRYVLAALLGVTLLALSVPAIEYAAGQNTDRYATNAVAAIDDAARSLMADEEISPPGHPSSQRVVTIALPGDSLTTHALDLFELERINENSTVARYQFDGRGTRTAFIDAPIVEGEPTENRTVVLSGTGEQTLALTLEVDDEGDPVIVVNHL